MYRQHYEALMWLLRFVLLQQVWPASCPLPQPIAGGDVGISGELSGSNVLGFSLPGPA
jgi:hypothetical protein